MPSYEYANLSPHDFEMLIGDLFQAEFGTPVERFAPGPDGGIDLRLYKAGNVIIQCKRYHAEAWDALEREAKKESKKVSGLQMTDYWFVTSCKLTPARKDKIVEIFGGKISGPDKVYGRHDIDGLLGTHKAVLRSHAKLWISSGDVLSSIVNRESYMFSEWQSDKIAKVARKFVKTASVEILFDILESQRACIISGAPGVGKTTLARIACLEYGNQGFQLNVVADIDGIFRLWEDEEKQIFFYDDFLGKSSLAEKLARNEDSQLRLVASKVASDPKKRIIFTTREYILKGARGTYEELDELAAETQSLILRIGDFSDFEKAKILYNHLFFSSLNQDEWVRFVDGKFYRPIIEHEKFSPRVIDWMTLPAAVSGYTAESFKDETLRMLERPERLWKHPFQNQIDDLARLALMILAASGGRSNADWLEHRLVCGWEKKPREVRTALKLLDDSFVTSLASSEGTTLQFHDPGIEDIAMDALIEDPAMIKTTTIPTFDWGIFETLPKILESRNVCWNLEQVEAQLLDNWSFISAEVPNQGVLVYSSGDRVDTIWELDFRRILVGLHVSKLLESSALASLFVELAHECLIERGPQYNTDGISRSLDSLDIDDLIGAESADKLWNDYRRWLVQNCDGLVELDEFKTAIKIRGWSITDDEKETIEQKAYDQIWDEIQQEIYDDRDGRVRNEIQESLEDLSQFFKIDLDTLIEWLWDDFHEEEEPDRESFALDRDYAVSSEPADPEIDPVDDLFGASAGRE